jgi:uncharacterized peroxidase-related enzyme
MYEREREFWGYIPNYTMIFSHRPAVMEGWKQLIDSIRSGLDRRQYELATLAAARALKSSYCSLAHGKFLADRFYTPDEVVDIAEDRGPLTDADNALMAFARSIATDASVISQSDIDGLRRHGFTDEQIFGIAAAASARCFFAKLLDALGAEPDVQFRQLPGSMLDALTVGRPIAPS